MSRVLEPELATRLAGLTLRAKRTVDGLLAGMHRSPHRGASAIFKEHREYRPGDDPRLIDWRAYARSDRYAIKHFEHETQMRGTLALDISPSMRWGSSDTTKLEHATTLLAALAYVLTRQGDAVSLITFDETIRDRLPPRSGPAHLDYLMRTLAAPTTSQTETGLHASLDELIEHAGRMGLVVIASDLLDLRADALDPIARIQARGHQTVVLHVLDPAEVDLPYEQPFRFEGLEGEASVEVDPKGIRRRYRESIDAFIESCRRRVVAAGGRYQLARSDTPPEHTLLQLLRTS
ncbi:MAG: DUF58 domain-containing protein [Myxococcales bacterium]|nr:DUF58 domain-containing protein [Myxococcales bacterium]MDH3483594.1 DUF58 domain-containing protein [Myxococcales bacterium]